MQTEKTSAARATGSPVAAGPEDPCSPTRERQSIAFVWPTTPPQKGERRPPRGRKMARRFPPTGAPFPPSPPARPRASGPSWREHLSHENIGRALRPPAALAPPAAARAEDLPQVQAACELAYQLSSRLGQRGQPVHACLSRLYASADIATGEVDRSLAVLRRVPLWASHLQAPPGGRVSVILPAQQPLYTLVTHVFLPAMVCAQVRAVGAQGSVQAASAAIFGWLGEALGQTVEAVADGSAQQWHDLRLGRVSLMRAEDGLAPPRESLAIPVVPDAIIWSSLSLAAANIVAAIGGGPVLMPQPPLSCVLVAPCVDDPGPVPPQVAGELRRSVAEHPHRPGGVPDLILVHTDICAAFLSAVVSPPRPWHHHRVLALHQLDSLEQLDAWSQQARNVARPTLTIVRYEHDQDLGPLLGQLAMCAAELSLFGMSSMATRLMPASRLYPGRMPVAADLQRGRDATVAEVDHCRLYTPGRLPQEVHMLGCLRAEVARAPRACLPTAQASSQPTGGAEGAGLA